MKDFVIKIYKSIFPTRSRLPKCTTYLCYKKYSILYQHFLPILSTVETCHYHLAKFLAKLLDYIIPSDHSPKDAFSFFEELKTIIVTNKIQRN